MPDALAQLQQQYDALLRALLPDRPAYMFHHQLQTRPTHDGSAHVESVSGAWHYVVTERGSELTRRIASDSDELLFWLMSDVTREIASRSSQPLLQQLLGRDRRRHRFATHIKLLRKLRPGWAERRQADYADVLLRNPYRDWP